MNIVNIGSVSFGDWFENGYGVYEGLFCEMGVVSNLLEWSVNGCWWMDREEMDYKEVLNGFEIKKVGNYLMDVNNESLSEFGWMFFNLDELKKLDGKVLKLIKEKWKIVDYEIVREDENMEMDYYYEYNEDDCDGVGYVIFNRELSYFKYMEEVLEGEVYKFVKKE